MKSVRGIANAQSSQRLNAGRSAAWASGMPEAHRSTAAHRGIDHEVIDNPIPLLGARLIDATPELNANIDAVVGIALDKVRGFPSRDQFDEAIRYAVEHDQSLAETAIFLCRLHYEVHDKAKAMGLTFKK